MPTSSSAAAMPVMQSERIDIIDSLRGFAILGILLMNIPGFGLPGPVGNDPSIWNESATIHYKIWFLVDWFPEGTQRAIFSMLFGAGIIMFVTRQEKRLPGLMAADYFFRRQLWLLVFGLIDIYILLWWGDILFDYACYGMIMFTFRKLSPKALIMGAVICMLLMLVRENRDLYQEKQTIWRGEKVAAIDTTKVKLTELQKERLGAYTEFKESSTKESKLKRVERSIRKTTGDYETLYNFRTNMYLNFMLLHFSYMGIWDVLLFMFLGMAFYKMDILTGKGSYRLYWIMAIVGLGLGLFLSYLRLLPLIQSRFNYFDYTKRINFEFYTLSRILRGLGIFAAMILLYKSGWCKWLFRLFRPVGQMAFTNYLTQSLICGIVFYGIGFGMIGKMQRSEIYIVVGCIWVLQITWSHLWLRYFNFGPLEWAWRSLTYWKRQPMRKSRSDLRAVN